MTRLKFRREKHYFYAGPVFCGKDAVEVVIDSSRMTYLIYYSKEKDTSKAVITQGVAKSLQALKRKAKKELKAYGAKFIEEIRNTGKVKKLKL